MSDVKVTFAFVTPGVINCCVDTQCSKEIPADVFEAPSEELENDARAAILKVLDYDTGYSRIFYLTYPTGTRMRAVYESLTDAMATKACEMICFTSPLMSSERVLRVCASRVLGLGDTVPEVVFCQKAAVFRQSIWTTSGWLVVNILLCASDGALSVGHLPCLVPVSCAPLAKGDVCTSISALFRMGAECERHLRGCELFCCTVDNKNIVLRSLFSDGASSNQVAILYSAVDVGDVVLVSAQLRCLPLTVKPSVFQAVVVRKFAEDGVTLFDVKEVDTSVILERLTCTQLVPL